MKVEYDLDVLKPHFPSSDQIARTLEKLKGVQFVSIKVDEIDQKTTSIFVTVKGTGDMALDEITKVLEEMNCAVHSVDRVQIENWR
ncbi:MAG: hypothetical protein EU532_12755 [Promethearchaeota archaeon]|nr:MAG: hypothetical protein EU532_12755 [Candidatus Lokiarchaeota archaeon]